MQAGEESVKDKNGWIYKLCFLVGMSLLLPWNAVLEGYDFFILKFQDYDPPFTFTLALNGANGVLQVFAVYFNAFCSMNFRVSSSLILLAILLVMIPLTSALFEEKVGYILAVTWVTLMGVAMSVLQTSIFGLVGSLPGKYTGAVMTGLALSGVFMGTIRIITLAIWSDVNNETTSLIGAIIYFVIAGIINVGSLFAYHYIKKHQFTRHYLESRTIVNQNEYRASQDEIVASGSSELLPQKQKHSTRIIETLGKIKWLMLGVFMDFMITFLMFPGVVLSATSPTLSQTWYSVLSSYAFNWGDMLGRYLCNYFKLFGPKTIWFGIIFRFIFIFTVLFVAGSNTSPDWLFHSDWFIFINLLLFGFTNGHFASICMIYGPEQVKNNQKEIAGMAMNMALTMGIFIGAIAAQFGMEKIDFNSL